MHIAKIELDVKNAGQIAKAIQPSLESHRITVKKNKIIIETKGETLSLLRAYVNTAIRLAKMSSKIMEFD